MATDFKKLDAVYEAVRKVLPVGELGLVGGCVRDTILGREPKDFDFATSLLPDEVEELVRKAGRRAHTTGKSCGTIGFKAEVMQHNDYDYEGDWGPQWHAMGKFVPVEVTTYRKEKYREGSRKPEVEFGTDLREDLLRRDFTINSLWYGSKDPAEKPELVDLFCGRLHIVEGLIKAVGEAQDMVRDDPLRILRAVRFKQQLQGFRIDPYLWGVCKKRVKELWNVAIERQTVELDKTFTNGTDRTVGLRDLGDLGYIKQFLPELLTENGKDTEMLLTSDPNKAWQTLLRHVGTVVVLDKNGEVKRSFNKKRHDFLCKGICSRFKFSNKRTETILGGNKDEFLGRAEEDLSTGN